MLVLHVGEKPFRRYGDVEAARQRGVRAERAGSGEEALEFLRLYEYDIVLIDLDLPDMGGHELIRRMRAAGMSAPVLAISDAVPARVRAQTLDLGADDFLSGPCDMDELLARMRAIIRRSQGHTNSRLSFGCVELNMDSRDVSVSGTRLPLSRREYAVLELLFLKKGVILTKGTFLNYLYCGTEEPEMKTIDVIICRLRKKLAAAGVPALIDTVWGSGYILRDAPAAASRGPLAHEAVELEAAPPGPSVDPVWAQHALAAD